MKALLLICCFIFLSIAVFAQNATIDSLKKVIKTTKVDTVRGRSLCRLCWEFCKVGDYENGIKKGKEGLAIVEKENDLKGEVNCLNSIGLIFSDQGNYHMALEYFQKSLHIEERIKNQTGIANCLNNIGMVVTILKAIIRRL